MWSGARRERLGEGALENAGYERWAGRGALGEPEDGTLAYPNSCNQCYCCHGNHSSWGSSRHSKGGWSKSKVVVVGSAAVSRLQPRLLCMVRGVEKQAGAAEAEMA